MDVIQFEGIAVPRLGPLKLTPHQADVLRSRARYEGQTRDLNDQGRAHMGVLAAVMRRQEWREHDVINFADLNGRLLMLDGYHRLGAQSMTGIEIDWLIKVHRCDTRDELRRLYTTFNTVDKIRPESVIMAAVDAAGQLEVSKFAAKHLGKAVLLLEAGFDFNRFSHDPVLKKVITIRLDAMLRWKKEVGLWDAATKTAPSRVKRQLATQGAMAVALATFRFEAEKATAFWGGISANSGLETGDPRHTYLRQIMSTSRVSGSGTALVTAKHAALAWNAFYREDDLQVLKPTAFRFHIQGTPIKAKKEDKLI